MVLKLQDNVNFVSLAQQGSSSSSTFRNISSSLKPPMPPTEAISLSKGLQPWSWPKMEGPTFTFRARCVCLMRDTVQFFLPSPRAGHGGPKQYISLMAWFCLAFTAGIQAPGCETRKALQWAAPREPSSWHSTRWAATAALQQGRGTIRGGCLH